jgi:hypothetical protein
MISAHQERIGPQKAGSANRAGSGHGGSGESPDVRGRKASNQNAPESDDRPDAQVGLLFSALLRDTIHNEITHHDKPQPNTPESASPRTTPTTTSGTTTGPGSCTTPCIRPPSRRSGYAGPWGPRTWRQPAPAGTRSSPTSSASRPRPSRRQAEPRPPPGAEGRHDLGPDRVGEEAAPLGSRRTRSPSRTPGPRRRGAR